MGIPYVLPYAAAKSAHLGLIRSLTAEWAGRGVRVNGIAPGWIETEMSRDAFSKVPDRKAKVLGRTPMDCLGQPQDIGWAAAYLASPAAKFITGVCLPVDGGASIGFKAIPNTMLRFYARARSPATIISFIAPSTVAYLQRSV